MVRMAQMVQAVLSGAGLVGVKRRTLVRLHVLGVRGGPCRGPCWYRAVVTAGPWSGPSSPNLRELACLAVGDGLAEHVVRAWGVAGRLE